MKDDIVIVGALRTPIGSLNGSLQQVSAAQLGSAVIRALLQQTGVDPAAIDEVIMGQALTAGTGQNSARQAALYAEIPQEIPAFTINHVCGSGLKAVHLAMQSIVNGDSEMVIGGGMENMSLAPYLLPGARQGYRLGHQQVVDSLVHDGLWCAIRDVHMGETAENIGDRYPFTREQLDEFAVHSHRKATAAYEAGKFADELVPISIPSRKKGEVTSFARDEHIRAEASIDSLAKLQPVFRKPGLTTAGNASGINDGAAAVMITTARRSLREGLKPLALIRANATAGVDPAIMGLGPVPAVRRSLAKAGLSMSDIDLIELNEAFAAQALAVMHELELDSARVNVNGGAIALGHPIGASGARVLVTLLHELRRRNARYGLATLCIGGGQGIATIVETLD
jgi:acetyl-CoA C-acetyltransferase